MEGFEEDNNVYYYEDRGHNIQGSNVTIYIIPETKEFIKWRYKNER
ncbi:hypothetical protein [Lachnobacterium bovis]|nr:hypothetical protein [Lachnobacterium bovis]